MRRPKYKGIDMIRVLILLVFIVVPFQIAYAECPILASKFVEEPNSMNANDLAALKKCVDDRLRNVLFEDGARPPIVPAMGPPSSPRGWYAYEPVPTSPSPPPSPPPPPPPQVPITPDT